MKGQILYLSKEKNNFLYFTRSFVCTKQSCLGNNKNIFIFTYFFIHMLKNLKEQYHCKFMLTVCILPAINATPKYIYIPPQSVKTVYACCFIKDKVVHVLVTLEYKVTILDITGCQHTFFTTWHVSAQWTVQWLIVGVNWQKLDFFFFSFTGLILKSTSYFNHHNVRITMSVFCLFIHIIHSTWSL